VDEGSLLSRTAYLYGRDGDLRFGFEFVHGVHISLAQSCVQRESADAHCCHPCLLLRARSSSTRAQLRKEASAAQYVPHAKLSKEVSRKLARSATSTAAASYSAADLAELKRGTKMAKPKSAAATTFNPDLDGDNDSDSLASSRPRINVTVAAAAAAGEQTECARAHA
jgi:hypothetical protein